uniref:Uncharacterized protein LOC104237250 n=1 Tax=Nicotiana sylvestris TaxID=4096 RepID=A0A1U7XRX1_NICSY|nr:PREDICTED: uncharacterized protein LOC104237250 [Nicotiana sylvestris]
MVSPADPSTTQPSTGEASRSQAPAQVSGHPEIPPPSVEVNPQAEISSVPTSVSEGDPTIMQPAFDSHSAYFYIFAQRFCFFHSVFAFLHNISAFSAFLISAQCSAFLGGIPAISAQRFSIFCTVFLHFFCIFSQYNDSAFLHDVSAFLHNISAIYAFLHTVSAYCFCIFYISAHYFRIYAQFSAFLRSGSAQEEIGEDECVRDEAMDVDSATGGTLDKKKVRGQTKCKMIHARNFEERQEVTFNKGQVVGPTSKRTKFIIPAEGKKWVMDVLRDAWRRHMRNIKKNHFDGYHTIEDMLKQHPVEIPEVQFLQLIEYWRDSDVQAICKLNSENRQKQKWRHRMGPINFARVRVALRASKENNEKPSKSEMFIATRTKQGNLSFKTVKTLGKHRIETFRAVFGKEQPGRIRCYGRSVTTNFLKKDEEINKLQQKHNNEVSTLKAEIQEMREEMQELRQLCHCFNLLVQNNPKFFSSNIQGFVGSNQPSPVDASSAQAIREKYLPHSSGSTHGSILEKEKVGDAIGNDGGKSI